MSIGTPGGPGDSGNVAAWMQYLQRAAAAGGAGGANRQPSTKPKQIRPAGDPWVEILGLVAAAGYVAATALFRKYAREGRISPDLPEHVRARFDKDSLNRLRRDISLLRRQGGAGG